MNLRSLNLWLPALAVLAAGSVAAQTAPEEIAANPERSAGVYHSYEYLPSEEVPVPKGYHPFYISHYGRHGSRYHYAEELYTAPLVPLRAAAALMAWALVRILFRKYCSGYRSLRPSSRKSMALYQSFQ